MNRVIPFLLGGVFLAAIALFVLPWVLFFSTEPFTGKLFFAVFFSVVALEKVWSTFFKMRKRVTAEAKHDWTTVSVGYSYTAVWYVALFHCFLYLRSDINLYIVIVGILIYLASIILRYWILYHLGHQWTVHVDEKIDNRHLVTTGPYRYARHPLYAEAFLEAIGIAMALGSLPALLIALLLFIPLETHRAYFEEHYLKEIFGNEYIEYSRRTWAFFPLPFGKSRGRSDP